MSYLFYLKPLFQTVSKSSYWKNVIIGRTEIPGRVTSRLGNVPLFSWEDNVTVTRRSLRQKRRQGS